MRKGQPQTGHVRRVFIVLELWQNNRDEKVLLIVRGLRFLYHSRSYAVADIGYRAVLYSLEGYHC